jgi:hypothetical protein
MKERVLINVRRVVDDLVWEAWTYLVIALDLAVGVLFWILVIGLVPGDRVGFNVLGSLVLIAACAAPHWFLSRYVRRLVA